MITFTGDLRGYHQHSTGHFDQWTNIGLTHEPVELTARSESTSHDIVDVLTESPRIESPVFVSDNKIKMRLDDMVQDVFYPIKYKNKRYMIGLIEEGKVDIYKVK